MQDELKAKIDETNTAIATLQVIVFLRHLRSFLIQQPCAQFVQGRMTGIKETLDARDTGRGDSPGARTTTG